MAVSDQWPLSLPTCGREMDNGRLEMALTPGVSAFLGCSVAQSVRRSIARAEQIELNIGIRVDGVWISRVSGADFWAKPACQGDLSRLWAMWITRWITRRGPGGAFLVATGWGVALPGGLLVDGFRWWDG